MLSLIFQMNIRREMMGCYTLGTMNAGELCRTFYIKRRAVFRDIPRQKCQGSLVLFNGKHVFSYMVPEVTVKFVPC